MKRVLGPALVLSAAPVAASAHGDGGSSAVAYETAAATLVAIVLIVGLIGFLRLVRRAGRGRLALVRRCALFAVGMQSLVAAPGGPLPTLAASSLTAHMIEHEIMMVIAAPLIALARPGPALLHGTPAFVRAGLAEVIRLARPAAAALHRPVIASLLHAAALWLWHVPGFFRAAEASVALHALQHASFFGSALLFWSAMLQRPTAQASRGAAALHLAATSLHAGALGALLTLSPRPWLAGDGAPAFGLSPLEDQQLAGLIMWTIGCGVYAAAAVALVGFWLTESGRSGANNYVAAPR